MALQSAISPTPLERFSTEDDISDVESINLRLSEGEDEDAGKKENQKTDSDNTTANLTADAEEEILNRFDSADPEIDSAIDEDALLNDKQDDTPKQNEKTEKTETASNDKENVPENVSEKEQEEDEKKKDEETEKAETSATEAENESVLETERMEAEASEELSRTNHSDRLRDLESVTKDLKDTVDTEDLLQVTGVKEADAANESSSSSSSEKDDSEEVAEQSIDDNNERDDDNDDLIDRPSESMDCGDMMDIEENNPLGVEVSEEMDKDYANLLNSEKTNELSKELENASTEKESNVENVDEPKAEKTTKSNEVVCNGDATALEKEILQEKIGSSDKPHINETQENDGKNIKTITDENSESPPPLSIVRNLHNGIYDEREVRSVKRSLSECETEIGSKKIRLTDSQVPTEQKIVILQTLKDFMKTKPLKKLSRRNVEEFCIQKICEVLLYKSEIGELKHQLQIQEQSMEYWKKETASMAKQVKDLEIVNKKLLNELKLKQDKDVPPVPVKITRSVGLQVKLETLSTKRIGRSGSEMVHTPTKSVANINAKTVTNSKSVSPQVIRQNKETTAPSILSAALLSQALTKDILPQNNSISSTTNGSNSTTNSTNTGSSSVSSSTAITAEAKGVIDLTDEDDKTPITTATTSTSNTTSNLPHAKAQTTTVRAPTGIAIVTSKPTTTGGATTTAPKFMYVLQPSPQLTQSADLSKPGGTKAFMFRLQNGVLGPTNGILPTLQNGSPITSLPQTPLRAGPVRLQAPVSSSVVRNRNVPRHPAPLPPPPPPPALVANTRKPIPPKPQLNIRKSGQGIVLSWKLPYSLDNYEIIASYQLYAYQETSAPPSTEMWRKVGDVKALALPMACTLTQFADGNKYYFAVRAVDVLKRIGPFSEPEPISL